MGGAVVLYFAGFLSTSVPCNANDRMLPVVAQQEWLARMEERAAEERVVVSGELAARSGRVEGLAHANVHPCRQCCGRSRAPKRQQARTRPKSDSLGAGAHVARQRRATNNHAHV